MKRIGILLLLLVFIGATNQHLIVDIHFEDDDVRIGEYNWNLQPDSTRQSGQWILRSMDTSGSLLAQTFFDPRLFAAPGDPEFVETITVPVQAPAGTKVLQVHDPDGDVAAVINLRDYCGDGMCEQSEYTSCALDCNLDLVEVANNVTAPQEFDEGLSGSQIGIIIGAALLIIILLGVMVHINRKKPNPVQMQY